MNTKIALLISNALLVSLSVMAFGCTSTSSNEKAYQANVNNVIASFDDHRWEYSEGLERIGLLVVEARTLIEVRQALQRTVIHLNNARQWFYQDMTDFTKQLPPAGFQDFHILMSSVLEDYVQSMTAFATYYSMEFNQGIQDLQLINQAQTLLRTANENRQRAALMYADLTGER